MPKVVVVRWQDGPFFGVFASEKAAEQAIRRHYTSRGTYTWTHAVWDGEVPERLLEITLWYGDGKQSTVVFFEVEHAHVQGEERP